MKRFKRELLKKERKKRERETQVGRGLFSVHLVILHFKCQFSKSVKSSTFHIFFNLTYPVRETYPVRKSLSQNAPKFTQNRKTLVNEISREIWLCLKRGRDIGRKLKTMLSDFIPALIYGGKMVIITEIWMKNRLIPQYFKPLAMSPSIYICKL